MKKFLIASCLMLAVHITTFAQTQTTDEVAIQKMLAIQTTCWNKGDIEGFMQTYWHSDSLLFIGKNGVQYGWQAALDNYKRSYPDSTAMGKLSFDILLTKKLSKEYYYIVGKWALTRSIGNLSGHYDLLVRKINGQWVIIADHSS